MNLRRYEYREERDGTAECTSGGCEWHYQGKDPSGAAGRHVKATGHRVEFEITKLYSVRPPA